MKLVRPTVKIIDYSPSMTKTIEKGIRLCYKSEGKICEGSDVAIIEKIKNFKHFSTLEHAAITVQVVTDRGVTHEQVRHRLAAYSQESTRYCNYSKDKFGNEISVIDPFFFDPGEPTQEVDIPGVEFDFDGEGNPLFVVANTFPMNSFDVWMVSCMWAEWGYNTLTQQFKRSAQEARSVLPNCLKTEIQITANPREWAHIFALRSHRDAHPQIRQIMVPLAKEFAKKWPVLFGEFGNEEHPSPAEVIWEI